MYPWLPIKFTHGMGGTRTILETRHLRMIAGIVEHGTLTPHPTCTSPSPGAVTSCWSWKPGQAARETLTRLEQVEDKPLRLARGREAVLRLSTECCTCDHWLPRVMPSRW